MAPKPGEVIDAPNGDHLWKTTVQGPRELSRTAARPDDEAVKGDLLATGDLEQPAGADGPGDVRACPGPTLP